MVPPTCTEDGYTLYTCSVCGYSRKSDQKNALGHDYQKTTVSATAQAGGYTRHTCRRCGDTFISDHNEPVNVLDVSKALPVNQNRLIGNTTKENASLVADTSKSSEAIVLAKAPTLGKIRRKGKSRFQVVWKKNKKTEKKILGYEMEDCENAAFTGSVNHYRLKKEEGFTY